jgi:DNA-binding transcriptional LysR family regulator
MTKASEFASLTPSGVQAQIKQLEGLLNTKLFIGHAQGVQLTGEGEALLLEAQELIIHHDRVVTNVKGVRDTLEGELKVIVTRNGAKWFSRYLDEFRELFPSVLLNLVADDERLLAFSSSINGITVGLSAFKPPNKTSLIWLKLFDYHWYPYAHQSYLDRYGEPMTMQELDQHRIIGYQWAAEHKHLTYSSSNILLSEGSKQKLRKPWVLTDDITCSLNIVFQGQAIAILPRFVGDDFGLKRLEIKDFDKKISLQQTLHFVYPQNLRDNKRITAFKIFIQQKAEIYKANEEKIS